ncbi:TPA: hypothetical protein DCX16_06740 [bacterium]|nr:hypothetical protein [bacterium]
MKKSSGILVLIEGICFEQGPVKVYDASGGFVCATDTIQWRIDACPDGGTVSVKNGTYTGAENKNLAWSGKHITVQSENGAENCIIVGKIIALNYWINEDISEVVKIYEGGR